MKNIPVFTTEHGAASLILKEIPYRQEAYITLRDTQEPEALLEECIAFCRACGARRIYASGHPCLEKYPLHTALWRMSGSLDPEEVDHLWPVTEQTVGMWRKLYNERMSQVDKAGPMESRAEPRITQTGSAYFVHHDGELLGIGWLIGDQLECIAAVKKGAGDRVLRTLLSTCPNSTVYLTVASTNRVAISLYERNGFVRIGEGTRWYEINGLL